MGYTKTVWNEKSVPGISGAKLNKIEQGIYEAHERIANMQEIPSGGTSADAALYDINIGFDGTDYGAPGDSVRAQAQQLDDKINEVSGQLSGEIAKLTDYSGTISELKVERKTINASGVISDSVKSLLTIPIELEVGMTISCKPPYRFRFAKDNVGNLTDWITNITVSNATPIEKENVRVHITKNNSEELEIKEVENIETDIISLQDTAIERNTNSIGMIEKKLSQISTFHNANQYDITSKSMYSEDFKVGNVNNKVCIRTDSSELITGNVFVIGEVSDTLDYKVAFDYSDYNTTGTSSYIVIELEDGTIVKAGQTNSYYWKIDNKSVVSSVTNHIESVFTPINLKGTSSTFSIVFADGHTVDYQSKAKNIYYEFTISSGMDVYINVLKNVGYTLERKCASLTLAHTPFAVYDNILAFCYYSYNDGALILETLNLATKESKKKTFEDCILIIDTHNYIDMAIDNDGYVHIMANCHYSHLYYYYGSVLDIDNVVVSNKLSSEVATYPQFMYLNDVLYATYREMTSSSGKWKVYKYVNNVFVATTTEYIADGTTTSPQACPYFQRWHIGNDGYAYNAFCWRYGSDVKTNQDICFIKTNDFVTFYNYKNEALSLPITLDNFSNCQIESIPQNSGLINQRWIGACEINGNACVWYMKYDEKGYSNIYLDYFTDYVIHTIKLTQFDYHWKIYGSLSSYVIRVDIEKYGDFLVLNIRHRICGNVSYIINSDFEICEREYLLDSIDTKVGVFTTLNRSADNSNMRMITEQGHTRVYNDSADGKVLFK